MKAVLGDQAFVSSYLAHLVVTRNVSALWETRPGYLHLSPDIAIYPNETKPWLPNRRDSAYLKICDAHRVNGLPISTTQRRCRIDDYASPYE